jgi:hypothetical protein
MAITNASGTIGTTIGPINSNWTTTSVASIAEIEGTPIYVQVEKSKYELEDRIVADYEIKMELCDLLVKKLLENNAIEFTKEENFSMGTVICRARIFATPKNQVQLLRVNKVIP